MDEFQQVPMISMVFMAIAAILCFITPLIIMIFVKVKTKASLFPILIGGVIFVVFVFVLERILHHFVIGIDTPLSQFIKNHTLVYALYGGLAAGVFEETGRFVAFKFLLNKHDKKITAITYGVGHGGIEAIIIGGLSMISAFATSLAINATGIEGVLAMVPEQSKEATRANLEVFMTTPAYTFLLSYGERASAIILHIGLSVLVFVAVRNAKKRYLFLVAIILHALIDVLAVLFQQGVFSNLFILEGIVFVSAVLLGIFALRIYKKEKDS